MKKILKFVLILFGIFIAISVISGVYQGLTQRSENSTQSSYDVGYEMGISGAIGEGYVSSLGANAEEICKFLLEMAQGGTPNDGINWASINSEEYLQGCIDGARESYPEAEWVNWEFIQNWMTPGY